MPVTSGTCRIRDLNDAFRTTLAEGKYILTEGVCEQGPTFGIAALAAVRAFQDFTPDNDLSGEHDVGSFTIGEQRLIWRIDYYDPTLNYGSPDPSDPLKTKRVLTIMLEEEY